MDRRLDTLHPTSGYAVSGSGYQQKDRKPSQNDKTEHGMEKTVQNQGQTVHTAYWRVADTPDQELIITLPELRLFASSSQVTPELLHLSSLKQLSVGAMGSSQRDKSVVISVPTVGGAGTGSMTSSAQMAARRTTSLPKTLAMSGVGSPANVGSGFSLVPKSRTRMILLEKRDDGTIAMHYGEHDECHYLASEECLPTLPNTVSFLIDFDLEYKFMDPNNTSLHTIDHEIGTRNEKERVVLERESRERIEREKRNELFRK
ncbi:hypothetical protein Tco_0980879 [Tanacetum coccineum]